jgi:UDP-N-acetylglucosamine--N-acetylmuramyl-(pentapeptide) pyrophosphoryl-undecaprenol N-acetylglucosamine transferase
VSARDRDRDPLRVVCYAVNGTGVGHVTRLLSIARWLRRYAAALDRKIEVWFLTSSEADGLVFSEGFAAFKIPSKTIIAEAGIDRVTYLALAKQWVWHTLALLRPDLFIADTFPRGAFGELLGALDVCRRTAFVYRPVRAAVAERPDFQAMLPVYDLVLVPEVSAPVLAPPSVQDRIVHVGSVLSRERWELLPRDVARAELGVTGDRRCVFVSAGGGGDPHAEAQIAAAVAALTADPALHVVVGAGSLYRGRPFPGVTMLGGRAAEWSLGFDAAVSAAGYNTWSELMFAGVPTAFLPQDKLADDQRARAELASACGAACMLEEGDDVHRAVCALLARSGASAAARGLVLDNGARVAAAELLRLVCRPADVDLVEQALDDARMARLPRQGEREALTLAFRLARGRDAELGDALDAVPAIVRADLGCGARELRDLVDAVARGLPTTSTVERASVCMAALRELGQLEASDGAAARAAVAEGRWGGAGAADGLALARAIRGLAPQARTA